MSEVGQANWGDYTTGLTPLNVPFLYPDEQTAYAIMSGEIGDGMREQLLADTGLRTVGFMHLACAPSPMTPRRSTAPPT